MKDKLNILVWHIHGSYLNLLVQGPHNYYLPVKPDRPTGYVGRGWTFQWPDNAIEVPAEDVRKLNLDLVIHQSPKSWFEDQYEILTDEQRKLPKIYLEHNTPKEHPTDTKHFVDDPDTLMVHVTHFNRLMWDAGGTPTTVVEHGAMLYPDIRWDGDWDKGIVVVNEIKRRNRVCGFDVFNQAGAEVPLDLYGFDSIPLGGMGDVPQRELLEREQHYRFMFNPIRYTSFPLAVVEAMSIGLPVVALATTDLPQVIKDGECGFISNDVDYLIDSMKMLLEDRDEAKRISEQAKAIAAERFGLERFVRDWDRAFRLAAS